MRKCRVESNVGNSHTYRSIIVRETNEIIFSHLSESPSLALHAFSLFRSNRFLASEQLGSMFKWYSLPHSALPIESV